MKIQILIDNNPAGNLLGEWGLAAYIEYKDKKVLLDTGATGLFAVNAERLGLDLNEVDFGVLSHAHDDHADGMAAFFGLNAEAKFYIRSTTEENCYWDRNGTGEPEYIGIPIGWLEKYKDRLVYAGDCEIAPGIFLLSHHTQGLEARGIAANMYRRIHGELVPEDFSHEQSLIFETEKGLVICNSCCHAGADTVIKEVREAYPGKKILGILGGFHLSFSPDEEVIRLANSLKELDVEHIITGHCTGEHAYTLMEEILGDRLHKMYSGFVIEF